MASSSGGVLRDLVHPSLNEHLKTQNSVSFKLVKTGEYKIVNYGCSDLKNYGWSFTRAVTEICWIKIRKEDKTTKNLEFHRRKKKQFCHSIMYIQKKVR